MIKLRGVYKYKTIYTSYPSHGHRIDLYDLQDWIRRTQPEHANNQHYKVKLACKIGRKWKLKTVRVRIFNSILCDCCGPHFVAEIQ